MKCPIDHGIRICLEDLLNIFVSNNHVIRELMRDRTRVEEDPYRMLAHVKTKNAKEGVGRYWQLFLLFLFQRHWFKHYRNL